MPRATKATNALIMAMLWTMELGSGLGFVVFVNVMATLPIISEIEGRMAPAATAAKDPTPRRTLSPKQRF